MAVKVRRVLTYATMGSGKSADASYPEKARPSADEGSYLRRYHYVS